MVTGMAEYIEREAAIAALTEFRDDQTVSKYLSVENCLVARDAIERATKVLESLPAADVVPVWHGRWLCVDTDTEQFFLCNRCKKKEYWESDYCPKCGARMDEEVNT